MAKLLPVLVSRTDTGRVDAAECGSQVLDALAARAAQRMGGENFPVALRLLPRAPRHDLERVYRFARFVDDIGDEAPGGAVERLALLDRVDAELSALSAGTAALAPVRELAPLVTGGRVPLQPFRDLVEANRVDQKVASYETFDELLGYCSLSANPVGRIVLYVAGAATAANLADSDAVCAALQVLEHCQDVGEDARAGRVYLPAADLREHGVQQSDLVAGTTSVPLRPVIARQVERSVDLLAAGGPLVARLSGWARIAVAGYLAGGLATADALRAAGFDVLPSPVRPAKSRTAWHALRLVGRRR